jgi:hypothetical protein
VETCDGGRIACVVDVGVFVDLVVVLGGPLTVPVLPQIACEDAAAAATCCCCCGAPDSDGNSLSSNKSMLICPCRRYGEAKTFPEIVLTPRWDSPSECCALCL